MKIKDLISILKEYDKNMMVVISGDCGGFVDDIYFEIIKLELNVNDPPFVGPHNELVDGKGILALSIVNDKPIEIE